MVGNNAKVNFHLQINRNFFSLVFFSKGFRRDRSGLFEILFANWLRFNNAGHQRSHAVVRRVWERHGEGEKRHVEKV